MSYFQAYDSILKERESEAKLVRAREEREKAEKVKNVYFYELFISSYEIASVLFFMNCKNS